MTKPWTYAETAMIVRQDDGTFYAEIPELDWNTETPTVEQAFDALMERAEAAMEAHEAKKDIEREIATIQKEITEKEHEVEKLRREIKILQGYLNSYHEQLKMNSANDLLDGDPSELLEDAPRLYSYLHWLKPDMDGKYHAGCIAFRLDRDLDGDLDLDHRVVFYPNNNHKRLVKERS